MIEMLNYADQVSQAKREKPSDDIASTLVQAEIDGDRLTDAELNWFFLLLVNAGGDTTRNLVAAGVQLLFDNPDERARLQPTSTPSCRRRSTRCCGAPLRSRTSVALRWKTR